MHELINITITTGVGLAILAGAYGLDLLVGTIKVLFSNTIKWSWKKMSEDLLKAFLIALSTELWVVMWYVAGWYAGKIGLDITEFTNAMSISGMIGAIGIGAFWYLANAGKNLLEFINTSHTKVKIDEKSVDYGAIVDKVKEFAETITKKTVSEQLAEDGIVLSGEEIPEIEAGQGGIANTYPEPYRSSPKDSLVDPSTCFSRECVSYCAWKICEVTGSWPIRTGDMNAKEWIYRLPSWGYKEVSAPRNGGKYIGVATGGTYGHVVNFEFDTTITEYNYASAGNFGVRSINLSEYRWYEIKAPVAPTPEKKPEYNKRTNKVSYTYKTGDTFGQVILDLGLATGHGLWGDDGDVAFYTRQLHEQGIYGNIPIGTTIKLTPRN